MRTYADPQMEQVGIRHRWRFAVVLVASLLLAVAQPLASSVLGERSSFDVFFSLLIAAVLMLMFEQKGHRRVASLLALAAFLGVWVSYGFGGQTGRVLLVGAHLVAVCFFAFALYGILRSILVNKASVDAIFGAACGYLLLGIIWTVLYSATETIFPGSFVIPATGAAEGAAAQADRGVFSYYSFITLATVGYGDMTPTTPLARTLAWIEAIIGQFYLAVLVAGLVGLKVTQALRD